MLRVLLDNATLLALALLPLWLLSLALRNASIIDLCWGPGFALVAWRTLHAGTPTPARWLLAALVTAWGLRLGLYLAWRNAGAGEDRRYTAMRKKPGRNFALWSLAFVFALQGALLLLVSLPVQLGLAGGRAQGAWFWAVPGVLAWCTGMFFECVGDAQLARFLADPSNRGRVLDAGLWRYTRHPNYFGDFMVWWGHYLVALAAGAPWWTAVGPAVMSTLLLRVLGVTLLEKGMKKRRPDYEAYRARTSEFFPRPPREL